MIHEETGATHDAQPAPPNAPAARPRPRPPKLYRIGDVVEYAGVTRQTIHNYTTMGLLRESRWTRGGHRLYDESVFERLDLITRMRAANRTLEEIRDYCSALNDARQPEAALGGTGLGS